MNLQTLEAQVSRHRLGAIAVVAIAILAYGVRFAFDRTVCLSPAAEAWGQFGDYVGGLLNPIIAFLAFYWLTQSVLIQKTELADTKAALVESAESQKKQVVLADRASRISALGSLLQARSAEVAFLRSGVASVSEQHNRLGYADTPDGYRVAGAQTEFYLNELKQRLEVAKEQQSEAIKQLSTLLGEA